MNSETITFVLPKELKSEIKRLSKEKNISLNALIRLAVSEYIERNK